MCSLHYNSSSKPKKLQGGQILLIVVLTMVVALTVGLSIASRIVTELRLSKQNEESQRAFQAAEAGIQRSLTDKATIGLTPFSNNSSFETTFIGGTSANAIIIDDGLPVDQTTGADVWLSVYDESVPANSFTNQRSGSAFVYWGEASQNDCSSGVGATKVPAIEVALIEGPKAAPTIKKYLFDSCPSRTLGTLDLTTTLSPSVTPVAGGPSFVYRGTISFTDGLVMKVIPIYNSSKIGLVGNPALVPPNFPSQGTSIVSTGISGDTVRKVTFIKSYPQLPLEAFPYSIISQ